MNIKMIFNLLLLFLASCATGFVADKELLPYVVKFQYESEPYIKGGVQASNLKIVFKSTKWMSDNTIGVCFLGGITPVINIDPEFWQWASAYEREALVFHELGHCLLKQMHRNDRMSIMNSSLVWNYRQYREYYIEEIFLFKKPGYDPIYLHRETQDLLNHNDDCIIHQLGDGITAYGTQN